MGNTIIIHVTKPTTGEFGKSSVYISRKTKLGGVPITVAIPPISAA